MFRFPKEQRLCNKKVIERLFKNGKSISNKSFTAIWILTDDYNGDVFLKTLIVVTKKKLD